MLPPFIIEQIRKREIEEQARQDEQQPRLDLPLERRPVPGKPPAEEEKRGVIIVEL